MSRFYRPAMDMPQGAPIAQYDEVQPDSRRRYQLFDDVIVVSGTTFLKSDYQYALPLKDFNPVVVYLRERHSLFNYGLTFLFIGLTLTLSLAMLGKDLLGYKLYTLSVSAIVIGVLLVALYGRKVPAVYFAGSFPLQISKMGSEGSDFENFIDAVVGRIKAIQAKRDASAELDK